VKLGRHRTGQGLAPQLMTSSNYVDVLVQLNPDLSLTVVYDGIYAFSNLDLSASLVRPSILLSAPDSASEAATALLHGPTNSR